MSHVSVSQCNDIVIRAIVQAMWCDAYFRHKLQSQLGDHNGAGATGGRSVQVLLDGTDSGVSKHG